MEVWLRPNRRVLLLGLLPAGTIAALGASFVALVEAPMLRGLGWLLIVLGIILAVGLAMQLRQPRIGYRAGRVLFFLCARTPVETPVEAVEAFFVGQSAAGLPGSARRGEESVNLVARISGRFPEWMQVEVKPALGDWNDGYATIRGAWCEPITQELVRTINRRLREAHEQTAAKD